jgi:hypothetical protein
MGPEQRAGPRLLCLAEDPSQGLLHPSSQGGVWAWCPRGSAQPCSWRLQVLREGYKVEGWCARISLEPTYPELQFCGILSLP